MSSGLTKSRPASQAWARAQRSSEMDPRGLAGRDFVSPEDIQAVLFDVLRHRIILSFEAEAAGIDQDRVVQRILDVVAVA